MPYVGCIEKKTGREVSSDGTGYHRVDLSHIAFGLTERHNSDAPGTDFRTVNRDMINFPPAKTLWGKVRVAFYRDLEAPEPVCVFPEVYAIRQGDQLMYPPGKLVLTTYNAVSLTADDEPPGVPKRSWWRRW